MVSAALILLLGIAAIAAGWGAVRAARRMTSFEKTKGTVLLREVVATPGGSSRNGGYMARVRYRFVVNGVEFESNRMAYGYPGYRHAVAERMLAAIPDQVDVWFDPANPRESYVYRMGPGAGYLYVGLGVVLSLGAIVYVLASR